MAVKEQGEQGGAMTPRERGRRALERSIRSRASAGADIEVDPARLAQMEDAVRRLPRMQRDIFLAVRLDDCSYADFAERTGLPVASIERIFAEALTNFCRNLDDPNRRWWRRWFG